MDAVRARRHAQSRPERPRAAATESQPSKRADGEGAWRTLRFARQRILRAQGAAARDGQNQDFQAYVFECGDVGEFGIWRRATDHRVDLVPWTRSPDVRTGWLGV
jgi:hypothetical protein